MGSRVPTSDTEPQGSDREDLGEFWNGQHSSVQSPDGVENVTDLADSGPSRPTASSSPAGCWNQHNPESHELEHEDGTMMGGSNAVFGRVLAHGGSSSITLSSLSVQSAPAHEARLNSSGSVESAAMISLSDEQRDQISTVAMSAPSQSQSAILTSPKKQPSRKLGPFEVPEEKFAELVAYRRSLALLAAAFIYTLFVFTLMLFKSSNQELKGPTSEQTSFDSNSEWTQEQIAGWHKESNLVLSREFLQHKMTPINIRVRDCKSYAAYNMHQYSMSLAADRVSGYPAANSTSTTTTKRPTEPPKRQFAALNGCMFRRDASSDSLGDLCCCSGIPNFKTINSTTADDNRKNNNANKSPPQSISSTTTKGPRKLINASTTVRPRPRRQYLRPHLMCFISASGSLFNSQKLVAPLVNEHNLRNAHIPDKGKCIPCSCCHEHEPELVNKLLANVPIVAPKYQRHRHTSTNLESVPGSKVEHDSHPSGVWVSIRERLVDSMRSLDEFLFHVYDMLDLTTFTLRHGTYPIENLPSNSVPFIGYQFDAAAVPQSRFAPDHLESDLLAKELAKSPGSLLIDGDTYDDFTTTTTTTSTTTSKKPSTKRAKRRRKKPKVKPNDSKNETNNTSSSAARLDGSQEVTVFIGKTRLSEAMERSKSNKPGLLLSIATEVK